MWQVKSYYKTGARNKERGLECQDRVAYFDKDGYQAISLADGAGKDDYASLGAKRTCEVFTQLLVENFDELYSMDDSMIQFNVITNIKKELYRLCDKFDIKLEQLQSTLLGIAVDLATERFIAVHLGDGNISYIRDSSLQMLSYPENGVNKSYSKLTSNQSAGKSLRIYKGKIADIDGFLLTSDGWGNKWSSDKEFMKDAEDKEYVDDVSYIALLRH